MKQILLVVMLFTTTLIFSQKNKSAVGILKECGFTTQDVFKIVDLSSCSYSFIANCTTHSYSNDNKTNNTYTRAYEYDFTKDRGERFTLLTFDEKEPSARKIKKFNKEKNFYIKDKKIILKEKDFFIKKDSENIIVIGFNFPKEELPPSIAFMAHSTGNIFIDKNNNKITRIEIKSTESFNMKIFHIVSMDINIDIEYNKEHKMYYVSKEFTNTQALILGNIINIDMTEQYSDFKFN